MRIESAKKNRVSRSNLIIPVYKDHEISDLEFDVAWGHFDVIWLKLWLKNAVFDQNLGYFVLWRRQREVGSVTVKIFFSYGCASWHKTLLVDFFVDFKRGH